MDPRLLDPSTRPRPLPEAGGRGAGAGGEETVRPLGARAWARTLTVPRCGRPRGQRIAAPGGAAAMRRGAPRPRARAPAGPGGRGPPRRGRTLPPFLGFAATSWDVLAISHKLAEVSQFHAMRLQCAKTRIANEGGQVRNDAVRAPFGRVRWYRLCHVTKSPRRRSFPKAAIPCACLHSGPGRHWLHARRMMTGWLRSSAQ